VTDRLRRVSILLGIEPATDAPAGSRPARGARRHAPRHAPRLPFAALVTLLLLGGLGLLLALNTASAANELRRHGLAARDSDVAATLEQLRNQNAASAAPANLADAAGALGMVPANKPAFVVVGPDGSVRVLGKAGPANAPVLRAPKTKKPTPTSTPAKTTAAATTSNAAKSTAARGRHLAASTAHRSSSATSSAPKPTPTPTPTVTLPGGPR
jgi:hypothetical protein